MIHTTSGFLLGPKRCDRKTFLPSCAKRLRNVNTGYKVLLYCDRFHHLRKFPLQFVLNASESPPIFMEAAIMDHSNYSLNHVALSVPSVEAAADWYCTIFGFTRLRDDALFSRIADPNNIIFESMPNPYPGSYEHNIELTTCGWAPVYPPTLNIVKVAYLVANDGIGLELFEFIDPPYRSPVSISAQGSPEYTPELYARGGFFHIAITVVDVDVTCRNVVSTGGTQIGKTVQMGLDKALYLMDPWGNVIELLTSGFLNAVRGGD